jgi:hypothetical protein
MQIQLNSKSIKTILLPRLVTLVDKSMVWLSSTLLRIFIVTISIGITSYLLYTHVWTPLLADVVLPEGISSENIKLNTELLKNINEQRISRIEHRVQPFSFDSIIKPKTAQ